MYKYCHSPALSEDINVDDIENIDIEDVEDVDIYWRYCHSPALSEEERSKRRRNKKERGGSLFSLRSLWKYFLLGNILEMFWKYYGNVLEVVWKYFS